MAIESITTEFKIEPIGSMERIKEVVVPTTGKSAYQLAVERGFMGTIDEWLESLAGGGGGPTGYPSFTGQPDGAWLRIESGAAVWVTREDFDAVVQETRLDQLAAPTATVNMDGQKLTGLPLGASDPTDAVSLAQMEASYAYVISFAIQRSVITAANQLVIGTGANTAGVLSVPASRFVGRKATGNLGVLTGEEAKTILAITANDVADLTATIREVADSDLVDQRLVELQDDLDSLAGEFVAPEVSMGSVSTILEQEDRETIGIHWPDGAIKFWYEDGTLYGLSANGRDMHLATYGSAGFVQSVIYDAERIANLDADANHAAGSANFEYNGIRFFSYHGEEHYNGSVKNEGFTVAPVTRFWSYIGLGYLDPDTKLPVNLGRIMEPEVPTDHVLLGENDSTEVAGGTMFVRNGYVYLFYKDRAVNEDEDGLVDKWMCVARCSLHEIYTAYLNNEVPVFKKYYNGTWTQPGLGGKSTDLFPDQGGYLGWFDLAYLVDYDQFMMLYSKEPWTTGEVEDYGTYARFSKNLLEWSTELEIEPAFTPGKRVYVTITRPIDEAGPDWEQHRIPGNTVDLYRVELPDEGFPWDDADLQGATLTLSPGELEDPRDLWHVVGEVGEPSFLNGWGNLEAVNPGSGIRFYREGERVYLSGLICGDVANFPASDDSSSGTDVFTIPYEYNGGFPATNSSFAFLGTAYAATTAGAISPDTVTVFTGDDGNGGTYVGVIHPAGHPVIGLNGSIRIKPPTV